MKRVAFLLVLSFAFVAGLQAQKFSYTGNWGRAGYTVEDSKTNAVQLIYSVPEFSMEDIQVQGKTMKNITLPGTLLFNDAGKPNLQGKGGYIAIPAGAQPTMRIVSKRTETIHNVDIAPAMRIPLDTEQDIPLSMDMSVYSKNAFYPESPVSMSEVQQLRGTDAVLIGVTPFQYNPVTKDLVIYLDLKVEVSFAGGTGRFGNDAFRSRWFDPILEDNVMNYSSLPAIDYDSRLLSYTDSQRDQECEYIIISPTGPDFLRWADSIANFRNQQGILTHVYTLTEVGGNTVAAIEGFIDNAYNTWTIKPAACLLLGDYGTDETKNITSHLYTHPAAYPNFASDNKYADVTNDEMPDVVFARMPVNDNTQLQIMCSKFLSYERTPPTDPNFYNKPITALGWQTERWFQMCSEIIGGYFRKVHNKNPRRINAIYQGTPGTIWSSATNTSTLVNYFGPNGLDYIPQQPNQMPCCWSGGTASQINAAIDSGAFIIQHRDHGNYTAWGEPAYNTGNVGALTNTALTFVFSINCETGAYHRSSNCLGEVFIRHFKNNHNSGALGAVCPTETSYSFVNDTYTWGMYDNMWPDFMPNEYTVPSSRGVRPAFGNAAGKYFLKRSNWPYNAGDKLVTYRLFHMLGDAFSVLYYEVPQDLLVNHDQEIPSGASTFNITTTDSAFVCLTVNNQIIGTGYGLSTGATINILPQVAGTQVMVTVTKQNFYRYKDMVPVTDQNVAANFNANVTSICTSSAVDYNDLSTGSPETWSWTFEGGTPSTSTLQNPTGIQYSTPGSYTVSLTVGKAGQTPSTTTKTQFIQVSAYPMVDFSAAVSCVGADKSFTNQSTVSGGTITSWDWNFGDPASGTNNTSTLQNPVHNYTLPGTYEVSLTVKNNGVCIKDTLKIVNVLTIPADAVLPTGNGALCQGTLGNVFATASIMDATSYQWELLPAEAGALTVNGLNATLDLATGFIGAVGLKVKGVNECGGGVYSPELALLVKGLPLAPATPTGIDSVKTNTVVTSDFVTTGGEYAETYEWFLNPSAAGSFTGNGTTASITWAQDYRGTATITVKSVNSCGQSATSGEKTVALYSTLGIGNNNSGYGVEIYPNPNNGKFNLKFNKEGNYTVSITIVDAIGNRVYSENNVKISAGNGTKVIDLSNLSQGVYNLKVEGATGSDSKKVLIKK
jgi:PKD repeat protein